MDAPVGTSADRATVDEITEAGAERGDVTDRVAVAAVARCWTAVFVAVRGIVVRVVGIAVAVRD